MKIHEIVAAAKMTKPSLFTGLNDPRAIRIVQAALQEIGRQVEATSQGPLVIPGFGRFVVKQVQPKAGATAAAPTKRVIFLRKGPPAAAAAKAKPAKPRRQ